MIAFAEIEEAALARHGREEIDRRLSSPRSAAELRALPDDRYLSAMMQRIFRAGLKHELVDRKWPAFEEVFHGFAPDACARLYDEDMEAVLEDKRLIRHLGKLRSVRANAQAMRAIAEAEGSFGGWIANWPTDDIVGLWQALQKRFQQMGGNSAPVFLRMVGKDTFIPTEHVVGALAHWGCEGGGTSRAERSALQSTFNDWAAETGRPLCQLSQILALSAGGEGHHAARR